MQKPDRTIKPVKKWLKNPDSVSKKEREANSRAAYAYCAAYGYVGDYAAYGACASYAADAAVNDDAARAEYWVDVMKTLKRVKHGKDI